MFSVLFLANRLVLAEGYWALSSALGFELNGREKLVTVAELSVAGTGVTGRCFCFAAATHFSFLPC